MKRMVSMFVAFCIVFGLLGNTALASEISTPEEGLDYVLGREMTEEEEQQQLELFDKYVAQSNYIEIEGPTTDVLVNNIGENSLECVKVPSAYDSRNVNGACYITPVRDQNPYSTCWAFSAIACMEAYLVKKGYTDLNVDLSERHLVYFSNYSVPDELGNSGKDQSYYAGSDLYQAGGNTVLAYRALAAWKGAVNEVFCPYEGIPVQPDTSAAAVYDNDYAHLTGYYRIASSDMSTIKSAIMEYGAVSTSYYASSAYLNASTAAYYCNQKYGSNHAITIVGWDDSYSRENFKTQPSSDGAWLVKNSWGTSFGDDGYFWLSYEDKSITGEMCAYEAELSNNCDNNYQYDTATGGMIYGYVGGQSFASVYTVKGNAGILEKLSAVAIELYSPTNVSYSLQIYRNLKNHTDPTSGEPMLSVPQTGILELAGYHSIPLNETVLLEQGDVFSVVIHLSKEGSAYINVSTETDFSGPFYSNATAQSGQSFVNVDGSYWRDYGDEQGANIRMKAFTENVDTSSVACSGVKISQDAAELFIGDTLQLSAEVLPENATNKSCTWKSSDAGVVTVSETGLVEAVGEGVATVTVTTMNGQYGASCQVTVKGPVLVEKITLSKSELYLVVSETATLTATVQPTNVDNKAVTWSSSDKSVATVDQNGKVTAVGKGTATITSTAQDESGVKGTCTVTVTLPKVATPTITKSDNKLTIKCATTGSTIYYTTDGSTPTTSNGVKGNGSSVTVDTFSGHLKAIAVKNGYTNSDMAKLTLFTATKSSNVSFAVKGVFGGRTVTFNSDTKGAKVYYSSTTSTLTTKDKCVNVGDTVLFENFYGTIYARTYKDGEWGNVCRLILKIPVVNTPTISIDSKGYATIKTTTPSCYLYYTTDGSTPSMTNGKKVLSPYIRVYVGKGKKVKAIAVRSCFTHSKVATK